jgi:hypothetical protein
MPNVTLYGIQEIAPAVPTTYDCIASADTAPEATNEVRLYVDTTLAATTLTLPPISSFNGIWNVVIWVIDNAANASSNNIIVQPNALSGDLICNGNGSVPSYTISSDNGIIWLEIAANGRWYIDGL